MVERTFTVKRLPEGATISAHWGGADAKHERPATHLVTAYEDGKMVYRVAVNDRWGAGAEMEADALKRRGYVEKKYSEE